VSESLTVLNVSRKILNIILKYNINNRYKLTNMDIPH